MENNELKRANELKELELKLQIWKEMYNLGKVSKDGYFNAMKNELLKLENRS